MNKTQNKDNNDNKEEERVDNSQSDVSEDMKDIKEDEVEKLKKDVEELQVRCERMTAQLQRAVADYHNLEKRYVEGRAEVNSWAAGELIKRVLPVLDNLEKAIKGVDEGERKSGWFKGVEMSAKQLQGILRDEGLDEIETDGQFDPALHEAVDMREGENDKILEVVEKGYRLNGKILRPTKVVVGKLP